MTPFKRHKRPVALVARVMLRRDEGPPRYDGAITTESPTIRTILLVVALAFSGLVVAADAPGEPASNPLVGSEWRLIRIPGRDLGQLPVHNHPRLNFEEARASGRGVCNPLTMTYTLTPPDGLVFGPVGGAMMRCRQAQQLEAFFINQLQGVLHFSLEGDTLEMVTRTGRRLQFGRLPENTP